MLIMIKRSADLLIMINVIPDDKLRMRSKRLVADVDNELLNVDFMFFDDF